MTIVVVSVDDSVAPFRVVATQRLTVLDRGDYSFVIPAPLLDVVAAPGSRSVPGLRRDAILWNGFNADRRVLAARATLRTAEAASSLPLRIAVRGSNVVLENVTPVVAGMQVASVDPVTVGRYLDGVRTQVQSGAPVIGTGQIVGGTVATARTSVEAPLRVEGTVGERRVALTLGDGHPLRATIPLRGRPLRLRLTVTPEPPRALLRPPGAATWTAAAKARGGAFVLRRTLEVLYRLARVRQYDAFLGDPDPRSPSRTTYVYLTAARAAGPPAAATGGGGSSTWRVVILAATALAVLGAGAFAWSRS